MLAQRTREIVFLLPHAAHHGRSLMGVSLAMSSAEKVLRICWKGSWWTQSGAMLVPGTERRRCAQTAAKQEKKKIMDDTKDTQDNNVKQTFMDDKKII